MFLNIIQAFLSLLVSIGGIKLTKDSWPSLSRKQRWFLVLSILTCIFICVKTIRDTIVDNIDKHINTTSGELRGLKTDKIRFGFIGTETYFQTVHSLGFKEDFTIFKTPSGPLMHGAIRNGKMNLDLRIRNERGELIAGIQDNFWQMYRIDYEYNNTDNSFEIVTPIDRKVLFQIQYLGNTVKIAGLLVDESHIGMYLYPYLPTHGVAMTLYRSDTTITLPNNIKRLFKYPRRKHLGKANVSYPPPSFAA